MAFQVTFTRLLSTVMSYHFSFLAVSLALLGTGAGALALYVRPSWFDRVPLEHQLARWSAVYALSLLVSPFVFVRLDYSMDGTSVTLSFALNLGVACLLATVSSLAAGIVVALAIRGYTESVGKVYAWDLVGAGFGALAIVPLLRIPAPALLVGLGVLAAVAVPLFAWDQPKLREVGAATMLVGGLLFVAGLSTNVLYLPMLGESPGDPVSDNWSAVARVQGREGDEGSQIFYDRVYAPVPWVDGDDLPTWEEMHVGPASIGYEIAGPGDALVIGGGGGRDILNALGMGQQVDVIELNAGIVNAVDESLAPESGSPYSRDGVSTTVGDGRSVLAQRDKQYDQIHIGFTDTLSANAAQGYALTENNLYTMEAFEEYLDHLKPDGILNVSRLEKLVGDEAIRATVLTLAALEAHGVEDPFQHIVAIRGSDPTAYIPEPYVTVLARLTPFTDEEIDEVQELAEERGSGVAYVPGGPNYDVWADLAEMGDWREFCSGYELNVCPPTDDKPFFFNMRRIDDVLRENVNYHYGSDPYQILVLTLGILVVLSVLGLLLPLRLARGAERPPIPNLLYFGAIGLGFLLLETVLIQRFVLFLGFPTYALSVVLFALLIFTGIGSALSSRVRHTRGTLTAVLGCAVGLIGVSAVGLPPLLDQFIDQPFAARVVLTVLLLAPTGIVLGWPMPLGLTRLSAMHPNGVPYAWGVNGIASVLASVLGIVIALNFGYTVASLVAGACYLAALAHAALGKWATPPARGGATDGKGAHAGAPDGDGPDLRGAEREQAAAPVGV